MDECQAFEEAKRRWGRDAHVRHRKGTLPAGAKPFAVGTWIRTQFEMFGQGETWEEAFAQADRQGK
jgi:hypothetical protein